MAHEFIDLKGLLFLVLITIPQTLSTNIDCGGKPFHCLNTTHFMICVDLGGGVSSTIDDFIIPCPPTTICEKNNRFECEFPKTETFSTDLNVIGVSNGYDKNADDKTIPPDKKTTVLPLSEKTNETELLMKDKSMSSVNSEILENLKDEFTGGNEKFFDEDIIPLSNVVNLQNNTADTKFVSPNIDELITTTNKYPSIKTNAITSTNGVGSASRTDISTLKENQNNTDETSFVSPSIEKLITTTDKYPQTKTNANNSTNGVVSVSRTDKSTLKENRNNTDETSFVSPRIEKLITITDKYPHTKTNANASTNGVVSASRTDIPTLKENKNNTDETNYVNRNIEKITIITDKYPHTKTNSNNSTNGVVSAFRTDIPTLKEDRNNTDETSFVSPNIEKITTITEKYPRTKTNANNSTNGVVSASRTDITTLKENKNNTDETSFVSPNVETITTITDKYADTKNNANNSTNGVVSASRTDIPTLKENRNNTDETSFVSPSIEKFITTTDKYSHTKSNANASTNGVVSASRTDKPTLKENKNNTVETSFVSPNVEKITTITDRYADTKTNANNSTNVVVSASRIDIPILKEKRNNTDETSFVSLSIEKLITTTDKYPHTKTNANASTNGVVSTSRTDIPKLKENKNNTDETSFLSTNIEKIITTTDKYPHTTTNVNASNNGEVGASRTDILTFKENENNTDETSFVSPNTEKITTITDKYPHTKTNANNSTNGVVSASQTDISTLKENKNNTDETSFVSLNVETISTITDKYADTKANANNSTNGVVSASRKDIPTLKENRNNTDETSFVSPSIEILLTTTDKYPHTKTNANASTKGVVSASRTDIPTLKENQNNTDEISFISPNIEKRNTVTDKYSHTKTNANNSTNGVVSASRTDIPTLKDNNNNTDETSFVSPNVETITTITDKYADTKANANDSTNGEVSASRTDIPTLKENRNNTGETSFVSPSIEILLTTTDKYPHTKTNANASTKGVVSASRTDIPTLKENQNNTDETSFVSPNTEKRTTVTVKYPHTKTNANNSTNGVVSASRTDIPTLKENKNNTDETSFVSPSIEKFITTTDKYSHTKSNANASINGVVSASRTVIPTLKENNNNTDETSFVSPNVETITTITDKYADTKANANNSTTGEVSASRTDIPILKENRNNTDETSFISPSIEKLLTTTDKYPHTETNANASTKGVVSASRTNIPTLKENKNNTDETSFVSPNIEKKTTITDKYTHTKTNANNSTNGVVSASRTDIPTLKENKNNTDKTSFVSPRIEKLLTTTDKYPYTKTNANASTKGVVSAFRTDIPVLKENRNNTDEISFVSASIGKLITTTDKYPHTKINANNLTNGVVSASRIDIPSLKGNITYTEESKTIDDKNTGNKFNTTKNIGQLYVNELNQTIDKFIGVAELTTLLPNSSVSIKRIDNIDLDADHLPSIHQSQIKNLDLQKKILKTVPISRNVSHVTTDAIITSEKVVATTSNATDIADKLIATKSKINNDLTIKPNTIATYHSVEPTNEKVSKDDAYSHTPQPTRLTRITARNSTSNTSGKDLPKLKETDTVTEGLIMINELDTSNKHNTTNKIDQNNINELNRTSDKFIKKLNSTTSQDLIDVSTKLELQQNVHNPGLILMTMSEMTIDTLSTTEPSLVTSSKYESHDNVDNVIASEAVVRNPQPVKANSTVSNYIVKPVSKILKNVVKAPVEMNINRTFNFSDKNETLQKIVTANISTKPVKQLVLESLSMQDSNGFTFKMTIPHTLVNADSKIGFKNDLEIKNKENVSIFNDSKIKAGINKTKEDYFPKETGNIDQKIIHNMKPTTGSQIKSADEQLVSSSDNNIYNLNKLVENKAQSVQLQETLVKNVTTFGNIFLDIEPTTTVDFIESSASLPGIISINTNKTNEATQNTTPELQPEAIKNSGNRNHQDTIIGMESDISSATAEINKTLKPIESNDITFKTSEIGTNSTVDTDAYLLPIASNAVLAEQVGNLSKLQNSVNLTLPIGQKDNITLEPLESVRAKIEVHEQNITNIMETTTELDGRRQYPLLTESVTKSIYSTNITAGTQSSNSSNYIVVSTQTVMEYTKDKSTLNDKNSNTLTSRSDIYAEILNSTAKSLFHPLRQVNHAPTGVSQDANLSPNNESKTRNNITTASVIDITESRFGPLLTSISNTKKPPIIRVNQILPSMTVGVTQHNTSILDNVEKRIVYSDVIESTREATTSTHELGSISTLATPEAVAAKKQPNVLVNRILSSTMASISQYNKDEFVKAEKQIVNTNIATSTEQIVVNDSGSISTVPTRNKATLEKQTNILVNRILPSTSINQVIADELAKVVTPIKRFNDSSSKSKLPTLMVSIIKEEPNLTVNRISLSNMASINQPSTDDLGKVETRSWSPNITQNTTQKVAKDLDNISMLSIPKANVARNETNITTNRIWPYIVELISQPNSDESGIDKTRIESSDITKNTRQIFVNGSDSTAILPAPHESTVKTEPNITVKRISLSDMAGITQTTIEELGNVKTPIQNLIIPESTRQIVANSNSSNTDELDKVQIQVKNFNMTQITQQTTSNLPTSKESISQKQHNITTNPIALNTLAPISQNDTNDVLKFGTQIVSSEVTRNTQQVTSNHSDKTSFEIVTEPAAIVETINDTHNIVGRSLLSDMILGDVIFMNNKTNLKSPKHLNIGTSKKIEKASVDEKLQKNPILRNTSSDLNMREGLNFEVVNGIFIDKQINIELSGSTHDNETSAENYESSTAYNKIATLVDVTSPSTPVNNKSLNTVGYKSPLSAMDIVRPGYMSNNFSELTQNITLKYIENSTNNTDVKVKNFTGYKISKQQIKQLDGSAVSPISTIINISYTLTNQRSNKSNLFTVIHPLQSANAKNPLITINANKEKNTTFTVDCLKLPRGKYADSKDCRKFYICVSKLQPIVGTCPINTVFSEINKQCTKNLSHCVRNNQFHCLYEGRFSDFLRDNIYYICVKNNLNGFLRYTLQCQNGYHLNKAIVKCEKNETNDGSVSNSSNVSNDQSRSLSNSDGSESSGSSEFRCKKEGKFPYPKDCRKYYACTKNRKDEYRRKIKSCSSEEIYDRKKKKCVSSDSEES